MQAIILAAGVGSRLGTSSDGMPKSLLEIGGKSILERQVDSFRVLGVNEVIIVTGYRSDEVKRAIGNRANIRFVVNARYRETNVLASWLLGSEYLSEDHFYAHGDTVFEHAILERLMAVSMIESDVVLAVDRRACADEEMKVQYVGNRITAISKQIAARDAGGEFIGVQRVRGAIMQELRDLARQLLERGGDRLFFEAALVELIKKRSGAVTWADVTGLHWGEIDFPEDLSSARELFRQQLERQ